MALLVRCHFGLSSVNHAVIVAVACIVGACPVHAQKPAYDEREVKATYLVRFPEFVEWPAEAFSDPRSLFVIGVLGDDPFGSVLNELVKGEVVRDHRVVVERFRRVEEIKTCHILFVSASETETYRQIFARLQGRSILTVGETAGFATRGGIVELLTEQNRIRRRVNVGAAKAAGLTISSRLLKLAEIVVAERTP